MGSSLLGFGNREPFYVVASGSMMPELEMYDIIVISENEEFADTKIGDIIVFNRPSDHDRVIVHRIISITDEDSKTVRTKGDANPASIPNTDYPITQKEYIGKVLYVIPDAGYVTQMLKPPTNYIVMAVIVGAVFSYFVLDKRK